MQRWQRSAHRINYPDSVGARLAQHGDGDRVFAIERGPALEGFQAVLHLGHLFEPHRIAAPVADDDVGKVCGILELAIGLQGQCLARSIKGADGRVDVRRTQRRT